MNDREKFEYTTRVLAEVVRRVDAIMESPEAGRLMMRRDDKDADALLDQLSAVRHEEEEGGWTFAREVLEALEGVDEVPLPARYGFWAVPGGVGVEVVARRTEPRVRRAIEARLEEQGVPVRELNLVEHRSELRRPLPLRCDLKETSFSMPGVSRTRALRLAGDEAAGREDRGCLLPLSTWS
jgi:hypothetical protein